MHSWKCRSSRENASSYAERTNASRRAPRPPAAAVHRRELLQPRRRELERVHLLGEEELDRLAVLERLEELDPRAVDARAVREAHRAVDRAPLVPPVARRRPAPAAARPSARACACTTFRSCSRLPRKLSENARTTSSSPEPTAASTCSASCRRVASISSAGTSDAADDLARLEERVELGVVHDDADVAQVGGRRRQRLQHRLDRRVVPLHRSHLDDLPRPVACGDDRVGVGERDAHRLLDEDVQPGVERGEHDLGVRPRRRETTTASRPPASSIAR